MVGYVLEKMAIHWSLKWIFGLMSNMHELKDGHCIVDIAEASVRSTILVGSFFHVMKDSWLTLQKNQIVVPCCR